MDHRAAGALDRLRVEAERFINTAINQAHLSVAKQQHSAANSGKRHWKDSLLELLRHYIPVAGVDALHSEFVSIGEKLVTKADEYEFSLRCCFEPYLSSFRAPLSVDDTAIPIAGQCVYINANSPTAPQLIRAITLAVLCRFKLATSNDPECLGERTVAEALSSLETLRSTMEWAQQRSKNFDWAVYNCSLHTYQICRSLISARRFDIVLEPLLWTIVALESVYTLMSRRHVVWRTRLYATVCECYYQLREDVKFKAVAERCVSKIIELQELEEAYGQVINESGPDAIAQAFELIRPQQFRAAVWTTTKPSQKRRAALKGTSDSRPQAVQGILEVLETLLPNESCRLIAVCQVFLPRRTMTHCPIQLDEMPVRYGSDRNALNHRRNQTKHIIAVGCELALAEIQQALDQAEQRGEGNASTQSVGCRWLLLHQFARLAFSLEQFEVYHDVSAALRKLNERGAVSNEESAVPLAVLRVLDAYLAAQAAKEHKKARVKAPTVGNHRKSRYAPELDPFQTALSQLVEAYNIAKDPEQYAVDILHNAARHLWASSRSFYAGSHNLDSKNSGDLVKIERLAIVHEAFISANSGLSNGLSVATVATLLGDIFYSMGRHAEAFSAYSDGIAQIEAYRSALANSGRAEIDQTEAAALHLTLLWREWIGCTLTKRHFHRSVRVNLLKAVRDPLPPLPMKKTDEDVTANLMREYDADRTTAAALRTCVAWVNGSGASSSRLLSEAERLLRSPDKGANDDQPGVPVLIERTSDSIVLGLPSDTSDTSNTFSVFGRHLDPKTDKGKEPIVRLKDTGIAGTNEPVSNAFSPRFRLRGLRRYHKYVFAAAPVAPDTGQVGKIGPTSYPVVTAHPLSKMDVWSRLGLAAFACEEMDLFYSALGELWNQFVESDSTPREFARTLSSDSTVRPRLLESAVLAAPRPAVAGFAIMLCELSLHLSSSSGYFPGGIDRDEHTKRSTLRTVLVQLPLLALECARLIRHEMVLTTATQQVCLLFTPTLFHRISDPLACEVLAKIREAVMDVSNHSDEWSIIDPSKVVSFGQMSAMVSYYLICSGSKAKFGRKARTYFFAITRCMFMYEDVDPIPERARLQLHKIDRLGGRHDGPEAIAMTANVCNLLENFAEMYDSGNISASLTTMTKSENFDVKEVKNMYDTMLVVTPAKAFTDALRDRTSPYMFECMCHVIGRAIASGIYDSALEYAQKGLSIMLNKESAVLKAAASKDVVVQKLHKLVNPYSDMTGRTSPQLNRELTATQIRAVELLVGILPQYLRDQLREKRLQAARINFRKKHLTWQAQLNLLAAIASAYNNRHAVTKPLPNEDISRRFAVTHCLPPNCTTEESSNQSPETSSGPTTTSSTSEPAPPHNVGIINASRIPWGFFRRAINLAERAGNLVQLHNICEIFLDYWFTICRRQASLSNSLVGAVLNTFEAMVTASATLVKHSKDTVASSTSGLSIEKARALAVHLFLEASLIAYSDGKNHIVVTMAAELLAEGVLDMDDTVLHIVLMGLHGAKSDVHLVQQQMSELKAKCDAAIRKLRESKLAFAIFDAYDRLLDLLNGRDHLSDAATKFRVTSTLFAKAGAEDAALAKRTRFLILHATILHASGDEEEAQFCWEAILANVIGTQVFVGSVTTLLDFTEDVISIASTGQPLLTVCGTSGVTVVGTIIAKLAQYSLANNVDIQKQLVLAAARCFEACLRHDSGLSAQFPKQSGVMWSDLIRACEFTADVLLQYELSREAAPAIDLMVHVASEMCRDHDLHAAALALKSRALAILSDFSASTSALTVAARQREWSLLSSKLASSEFICHQADVGAGDGESSFNFVGDQPLWANKSGYHKNGMVVNHLALLDFSAATHLQIVRIHLLEIERARLILRVLEAACPELEGNDPRNDNKPSKTKRRHLPYGPAVNKLLAVAKEKLELARRYGIQQKISPLVLECSFLMSKFLLYEGHQRAALTLIVSVISSRSTLSDSTTCYPIPTISALWWLLARVQLATVLYAVGQIEACREECAAIILNASDINDRSIVLAALDLSARCNMLRGKGGLTLNETHHFAAMLREVQVGSTQRLQYSTTVAAALEFCGETREAYALISLAEKQARKLVEERQSRDDYNRLAQVLGSVEAVRAELASTIGDKAAVLDAAKIGSTYVGGSLLHRQPFLLAEFLLAKAGCEPDSVELSELKEVLVSAVNSGRVLLARRACVAAVRHSIAKGNGTAAVLFIATANALFSLREKVKEDVNNHVLDAPTFAVLGSVGNAVQTLVNLWDDRHDIATMAPAVSTATPIIDGATLFTLREDLERAAALATPPTSFRMAPLIEDISTALKPSPHYSLNSVKDCASRETLVGSKVASTDGGICFMWESSAVSPMAYLFVVAALPKENPQGYERRASRNKVFEIQTAVRDQVSAGASGSEELAGQVEEVLGIHVKSSDLTTDVLVVLDQLLNVRHGGGQISGGPATSWVTVAFQQSKI